MREDLQVEAGRKVCEWDLVEVPVKRQSRVSVSGKRQDRMGISEVHVEVASAALVLTRCSL